MKKIVSFVLAVMMAASIVTGSFAAPSPSKGNLPESNSVQSNTKNVCGYMVTINPDGTATITGITAGGDEAVINSTIEDADGVHLVTNVNAGIVKEQKKRVVIDVNGNTSFAGSIFGNDAAKQTKKVVFKCSDNSITAEMIMTAIGDYRGKIVIRGVSKDVFDMISAKLRELGFNGKIKYKATKNG